MKDKFVSYKYRLVCSFVVLLPFEFLVFAVTLLIDSFCLLLFGLFCCYERAPLGQITFAHVFLFLFCFVHVKWFITVYENICQRYISHRFTHIFNVQPLASWCLFSVIYERMFLTFDIVVKQLKIYVKTVCSTWQFVICHSCKCEFVGFQLCTHQIELLR